MQLAQIAVNFRT